MEKTSKFILSFIENFIIIRSSGKGTFSIQKQRNRVNAVLLVEKHAQHYICVEERLLG